MGRRIASFRPDPAHDPVVEIYEREGGDVIVMISAAHPTAVQISAAGWADLRAQIIDRGAAPAR